MGQWLIINCSNEFLFWCFYCIGLLTIFSLPWKMLILLFLFYLLYRRFTLPTLFIRYYICTRLDGLLKLYTYYFTLRFCLIFNPWVAAILCISFVLVYKCVVAADIRVKRKHNLHSKFHVESFRMLPLCFNCTAEVIKKCLCLPADFTRNCIIFHDLF